ncbi:MAG: Serine/threonine-protein kinase PknD [Planctomycetes bacterium]|nr:Serine/threonine-protein kinase PknD [Planctomycetota bacterium]
MRGRARGIASLLENPAPTSRWGTVTASTGPRSAASPARDSRAGADGTAPTARVAELEEELLRLRADRDEQARMVEEELVRLSQIYQKMGSDLDDARQERDRLADLVRQERERRAREMLEMSERLEDALAGAESRKAGAPQRDPITPERFVQERLARAQESHAPPKPGDLPSIPGYRILAPLGQGGMATVYQALADDGREVAIKVLHDGPDASKGRMELFLREAAVMLQLSHPGLVGAVDAGDAPCGRYLVLELVRGESLAAIVRRDGPMPEKEVLRVGLQVARALAYCARLGLTHRDVKPSNLLRDPTGRVRVCDFGLAALSSGGDPARPYGSPGYAAPEQITNPTSVDERVDIYALGCTLWHLAVGRRPFSGQAKEVFEQQRANDIPDPRYEGGDVTPRFAQVLRRMGRAQRDRRYRKWDECILDLMLVEQGNPPFAAALAEAQEPGSRALADSPPDGTEPSARGAAGAGSPASATSGMSATRGMSDTGRAADAPRAGAPAFPFPPIEYRGAPAPATPAFVRRLGPHATPILTGSVAVLGIVLGLAAASFTHRSPRAEFELRAVALRDAGRPDEAARLLRSAAETMEGEDRAALLRLAESILAR